MTDNLSPLFADRKTRLSVLPDEQRMAFESLEKNSGDAAFADRQFSALWMSKRTGLPQEEVLKNFDGLAARYFGEGTTPSQAYDRIAATYNPHGVLGQGEGGENAPEAKESALMAGGTVIAKDVAGSLAGGASRMGYDTLGGFYANLASVTGVTMKRPQDDPEYQALARSVTLQDDPLAFSRVYDEPSGFGGIPDEVLIAEDRKKMSVIADRIQAENMAALEAAQGTFAQGYSENARKIATTMYDLSRESLDAYGVRSEFQDSTVGQFVATAGSLPVTALYAALGPALGAGGIYASIYGQVEQERMAAEGDAYDPQAAFLGNLASAGPQAALEFAFGMERIMGKIITMSPKVGGRIAFGDAARLMGKTGLIAGTEEALTEPAQGFWNDWVASLTYDEKRELLTEDVLKQRIVESASAFALGFLFGGAVQGLQVADRNRGVTKAERFLTTRDGQLFEAPDFAALRAAKTDEELRAMAGDPSMADTLVQAANGNVEAQAAYRQETLAKAFVDTDGLAAQGFTIGKVGEFVAVRDGAGRITTIDPADPVAGAFLREVQGEAIAQKEATDATLAQAKARFGETLEIESAVESPTLREMVDAGTITLEDAEDALATAKAINGLAQEVTLEQARPQGQAKAKTDASGIVRMVVQIAQGKEPTVAIEEVAEAWKHKAVKDGKLDPAELTEARKKWNADNGEADPTEGGKVSADRADTEWFSKRVIDYALANRKTELPEGWGKWLRAIGDRLREVLKGAVKMRKLMRDGQLDPKLEGWFREALGVRPAEISASAFQKLTPAEKTEAARDALRQSAEGLVMLNEDLRLEMQSWIDAERDNRETAPLMSELDEEQQAVAMNSETFPKIEGSEADGWVVTSPEGEQVGRSNTLEGAQDKAMAWWFEQERQAEREAAKDEPGRKASDELQRVVIAKGGLLAASAGDMSGELKAIGENMNAGQRMRFFRKDGLGLDALREAVNEEGFTFETVNDLLVALDQSTRGNPVYPNGQAGGMMSTFSLAPMFSENNRLSKINRSGAMWERIVKENPSLRSAPTEVTAYRAAIGSELRPNDFVALKRQVAVDHLENLKDRGESGTVTAHKVKVTDLLMGNDATEFVWFPEQSPTFSLAQTETPEFARWFGNSKVVDADGKPLVVYHGTTGDFTNFDMDRLGQTTGADSAKAGFFFTDSTDTASNYANAFEGRETGELRRQYESAERKAQRSGKRADWDAADELSRRYEEAALAEGQSRGGANVMPVFLSIQNPHVYDFAGRQWQEDAFVRQIAIAIAGGKDGVVFQNVKDDPVDKERSGTVYVAFEPTQIKSAIGNRGTFDPANPDITFSLEDITFAVTGIPQNRRQQLQRTFNQLHARQAALFPYPYQQLAALPVQAKVSLGGHEAGLAGRVLLPVSERLRLIADRSGQRIGILTRVRRYYSEKGTNLRRYSDQVTPLMRGIARMNTDDLRVFGVAASNQDALARNVVLAKYGLQNEWASYEAARDALRNEMIAAGMEVGDIGEYFPRWVRDVTGLRESMSINASDGVLEQAVIEAEAAMRKKNKRGLSDEEVNAVIDGAVRGVSYGVKGGAAPSNTKQRKIVVIMPNQWQFYADPNQALSRWLNQSTEAIARYRFFGKNAVPSVTVPSQIDTDVSIGNLIAEELQTGALTEKAQLEITQMLDGLFAYHGQTNKWMRAFMDLSYWATMGKLSSALAQATDLMVSVYEAGPWNTFVAIPEAMWRNAKALPGIGNSKTFSEAVANFTKGKDWLTREELGIDRIMEEFNDQRFTTRALNQVFTATGLNFMDGIGKDVLLNAKFRQLTKQAKKGQLSASNQRMIEGIFGKAKAVQVIAEFRANRKNADTIFAVYNVLADWQPISLAEYPEAYAKNPNARVLYMLKSYSIKMLAAYRREGLMKMWWGSPEQKIEGARNLSYLLALLFMAGASKDWLVDFMLDRDPQMEDIMVDNIFKLMQVSRYALWQQRNRATDEGIYGGVGAAAQIAGNIKQIGVDLIAPPFTLIERPMKDVQAWAKAAADYEPWSFYESESIQFIPVAGEFLYWTGPTGQGKIERRRALRDAE